LIGGGRGKASIDILQKKGKIAVFVVGRQKGEGERERLTTATDQTRGWNRRIRIDERA